MYGIFELSLSYFIVVMRNDHLKEETEKNVNLGRDEKKLGVDPPPSPTTPASYGQFFL